MSNLDKSLDEIISAKPKTKVRRRRASSGVSKVANRTKKVVAATKKQPVSAAKIQAIQSKLNPLDEASRLADKVIISNLVG